MARYSAEDSKAMEYQGADTFRIEKDGGRAQVVFLYTDESSVDGWSVHRLPGANYYTFTVDCARGPKDPLDKCPGCLAGAELSTRVFVRMLDVSTGKVMIWDKPASYRKELAGLMHYHNPLYKQKCEITREGTGLNTRYRVMPIGESGITEEQYRDLVKKCDEVCESYVRPADKFEEIKARSEAAQAEAMQVNDNPNNAPQQNAWAQNQAPQAGWCAPPQAGWGAVQNSTPQQAPPQAPPSGWGQAPQQTAGWGSTPQGAWQNNPQN